jgi:hypothetical protein
MPGCRLKPRGQPLTINTTTIKKPTTKAIKKINKSKTPKTELKDLETTILPSRLRLRGAKLSGFYNEGLLGKAVRTGRVYKPRKASPLKGKKKPRTWEDTLAGRFMYTVRDNKNASPEEKQHAVNFFNLIPLLMEGSKDYSLKSLRQGLKLYDSLVEKGYKYVEGKGKDCIRAHMKKYWFEVVRKEGLQLIPYCGGIITASDEE